MFSWKFELSGRFWCAGIMWWSIQVNYEATISPRITWSASLTSQNVLHWNWSEWGAWVSYYQKILALLFVKVSKALWPYLGVRLQGQWMSFKLILSKNIFSCSQGRGISLLISLPYDNPRSLDTFNVDFVFCVFFCLDGSLWFWYCELKGYLNLMTEISHESLGLQITAWSCLPFLPSFFWELLHVFWQVRFDGFI